MASLASTASSTREAIRAGPSPNASAFAGLLFHTVTSNPADTVAPASAAPIKPSPMMETLLNAMATPPGRAADAPSPA